MTTQAPPPAGWIDELDPTIVIMIAGANDVWNAAEMDDVDGGWRSRLGAWTLHLRTVRFIQSWRAQRGLDAELDNNKLPFGDRPKFVLGRDGYVDWGDGSERILNERRDSVVDVTTMRHAVSDYEEIAHTANRRGLRFISPRLSDLEQDHAVHQRHASRRHARRRRVRRRLDGRAARAYGPDDLDVRPARGSGRLDRDRARPRRNDSRRTPRPGERRRRSALSYSPKSTRPPRS
jgi:hypothetical protein